MTVLQVAIDNESINEKALALAHVILANPANGAAEFAKAGITIDGLLIECRKAILAIEQPPVPEVVPQEPAVSVRKSVTPDFIICLEDGKKFKSLKRHLKSHYDMTPEQYREKWNLPADYPMVAPNYSATRSNLAKASGLGTKK